MSPFATRAAAALVAVAVLSSANVLAEPAHRDASTVRRTFDERDVQSLVRRFRVASEQARNRVGRGQADATVEVAALLRDYFALEDFTNACIGELPNTSTAQQRLALRRALSRYLQAHVASRLLHADALDVSSYALRAYDEETSIQTGLPVTAAEPTSIIIVREPAGLRAIDVRIESVSLLAQYREGIRASLRARGVDGTIGLLTAATAALRFVTRLAADLQRERSFSLRSRPGRARDAQQFLRNHVALDVIAESCASDSWDGWTGLQRRQFRDALGAQLEVLFAMVVRRLPAAVPPIFHFRDFDGRARIVAGIDLSDGRQVDLVLVPTAAGWRLLDVRIASVSMLRQYRSAVRKASKQRGLKGSIDALTTTTQRVTRRFSTEPTHLPD